MFKILKGKKNKKLWQLVGLIFLLGAIVAGVLLVKQSQDIREKAQVCTDNIECSGSLVCIDGECRPPYGTDPSSCTDNTDCEGSKVCIDGKCRPPYGTDPSSCTDNTDCEGSKVCIDGKCSLPVNGDGDDGSTGDSDNSSSSRDGGGGSHPKCSEEYPCGPNSGCSNLINRCFSKSICKRFRILKCE